MTLHWGWIIALAATMQACQPRNFNSATKADNGAHAANFAKEKNFFFGIATAPAHVEDQLEDGWLDFARAGKVAAFKNVQAPEERLRFWTNPDEEIELAAKSGVKVFRMGVDWGRLQPGRPGSKQCDGLTCPDGIQDQKALKRYKEIVAKARAKGMSVMMTLFHHSLPKWSIENGGWTNAETTKQFTLFSKDVVTAFRGEVDYWITFNEPAVFAVLTYVAGMWPPGIASSIDFLGMQNLFEGKFHTAIDNMVEAHKQIYAHAKKATRAEVGIAHNVGYHIPTSHFDIPSVLLTREMLNHRFPDLLATHLDFLGLNYYGAELVKGASVDIEDGVEYSDSGRAVDPYGFYATLKQFHERYNVRFERRSEADKRARKMLPFMITENGVADETDLIRPAYLVEHLVALRKAMDEGVPVQGYVFWTISDNWEWADGYCPKFGLVSVDRGNGLKRTLRPSFGLFRDIATSKIVTKKQRTDAWSLVQRNVGKPRSMCRSLDGKTSLDVAVTRPIQGSDWRFTGDQREFMQDQVKGDLEKLSLPSWVGDAGSQTFKFIKHVADGIKNAVSEMRVGVESWPDGQKLLAIHLPPGKKVVCRNGPGGPGQTNLVFSNTVYFTGLKLQDPKTVAFKIYGMRAFIGPPGPKDALSNFLPRFNLQDVTMSIESYSLADPAAPLAKVTHPIDWTKLPPLTCRLVAENVFGDGFKGK